MSPKARKAPPESTTRWPTCACGQPVCPEVREQKLGSVSAPLRFQLYKANRNRELD
jgi:hypothetical protein